MLKDIDYFSLILEAYGWDEKKGHTQMKLATQPEASYTFATATTHLEAKFHEPLNMISLCIRDIARQQNVQFHFMYHEQPQVILEWIAKVSPELSIDNYPIVLKGAAGKCEMILLEMEGNKMYEVIPPTI